MNRKQFSVVLLVATAGLLNVAIAETRTWTGTSGKFHVDAELIEVAEKSVRLRKADGEIISVPLATLSKADRTYLHESGKLVAGQSTKTNFEDSTVTEAEGLLMRGDYASIQQANDPHGQGLYAFARFQLSPDAEMGAAAKAAHDGGDYLGTFVLMLCHEQGRVFGFDKVTRWKLNHRLRIKLDKIAKPSPIQRFVLGHLSPADENGVTELKGNISDSQRAQAARRLAHLRIAADAGFAEACNTIGRDHQNKRDHERAYRWYERAAQVGLSAGMRNQSFLALRGLGITKNEKLALELAVLGAEAGDCMSNINLAMHHEKGWGTEKDSAKARQFVERAATTGHWMGYLEKGFALHMGNYGFEIDRDAGKSEFQKALATRNREALETLSQLYAQGKAVERNEQLAVDMAEAAFVQGSTKTTRLLAYLYSNGVAGQPADKEAAEFWQIQSTPAMWPLAESNFPYRRRLEKIDPWAIKIP